MGVADNKTYKDQYHFNDKFFNKIDGEAFPSLNPDNKEVKTTIKNNPYRSNVEIEKDEIILKDDLTALFKAKGKKHSAGGIDVQLKPNSFVFSDDKSLAINDNEKELFELKKGGKVSPDKNTPAEVLKKNIDVEHYNRLFENLKDPFKDDLAKKSSARMIEKYLQTIGNIAFLQEGKKGFPDGLPPISEGTAPVFDSELENELSEQKQYVKYGGKINNPYMQRGGTVINKYGKDYIVDPITGQLTPVTTPSTGQMQPSKGAQQPSSKNNWGLWMGDKLPIFSKKYGRSNAADKITDLDVLAKEIGYDGPKDNLAFQQWLYKDPLNKEIIDKWHTEYDEPNIGQPADKRNRFDGKIGIRWANAINEIVNRNKRVPTNTPTVGTPQGLTRLPGSQIEYNAPKEEVNIDPNPVNGAPQKPIRANWEFTPWQKASMGYDAYKLASARRYNPYRSQVDLATADPYLLNPEQAISDIKSVGNQQTQALNTLSPILRNAQAAAITGNVMDRLPGVRSQYDNQNAQISNQFRQYNNQVNNQERMTNSQLDQQYYQQVVTGLTNYDNMKSFLRDQAMSNLMTNVQDNQSLAYNLLTQDNPVYDYDWKTGDFTRKPFDIKDLPSQAPNDQIMSQIMSISDPNERLKRMIELKRIEAYITTGRAPRMRKQGGKIKGNPYK